MQKSLTKYVKPFFGTILFVLSFIALLCLSGHAEEIPLQLISAEQAQALKKQDSRAIFVDVRDSAAFAESHIPTAINIPLHFIKTKAYLKNMNVILVDAGYYPEKLLTEQRRLSAQGFNTHILAGGIAAWQQQGYSLTGHPQSDNLHIAPARNFLPGLHSALFRLFIDSSLKPSLSLTDSSINVPTSTPEERPQLEKIIKQAGLSELDAVLIYNQDGDYTHLQELPENCRPTVFFLEGGITALNIAVEQNLAMLQSKESRTKKIGGCATCPPQEDTQNNSN